MRTINIKIDNCTDCPFHGEDQVTKDCYCELICITKSNYIDEQAFIKNMKECPLKKNHYKFIKDKIK